MAAASPKLESRVSSSLLPPVIFLKRSFRSKVSESGSPEADPEQGLGFNSLFFLDEKRDFNYSVYLVF